VVTASIPAAAGEPAYGADGQPRDEGFVAEVTDLFDLSVWPPGMRLIVREERPHPGAQPRITDVNGMRITALITNTTRGQLADLQLRHRRRARAEDRIRAAPFGHSPAGRSWPRHDRSAPADPRHPVPTT
jgi:hypothetical protein